MHVWEQMRKSAQLSAMWVFFSVISHLIIMSMWAFRVRAIILIVVSVCLTLIVAVIMCIIKATRRMCKWRRTLKCWRRACSVSVTIKIISIVVVLMLREVSSRLLRRMLLRTLLLNRWKRTRISLRRLLSWITIWRIIWIVSLAILEDRCIWLFVKIFILFESCIALAVQLSNKRLHDDVWFRE